MTLTVGSLFTGVGGLDLGLELAGLQVAWQCEIDASCRKVLARHWPDVHCHDNVRTLKAGDVTTVDVLCGGFPCQDVSVAGRREGLVGSQSGLYWEFIRVAARLAPTWLLIENVPGLLSSNSGRDMGAVLGGLEELGYGWAYRVLDAQHFGVAQRRRRVFIVGHSRAERVVQVLFESSCLPGDPPPCGAAGEDVAGTLGSRAGGGRTTDLDGHGAYVARPVMAHPGGRYDGEPETFVASAITASAGHHGRSSPQAIAFRKKSKAHGRDGRESPERWVPSDFTDTISVHGTTSAVVVLPPTRVGVRRLTPVECERLQGFPDGWTDVDSASDSTRYRQLGNAVCVPVAYWLGRRLRGLA